MAEEHAEHNVVVGVVIDAPKPQRISRGDISERSQREEQPR